MNSDLIAKAFSFKSSVGPLGLMKIYVLNLHLLCLPLFLDRPELISTVDNCNTKPILLGSNLSLPCPFRNFHHIKWLKNGAPFNDDSINVDITNISLSDEGDLSSNNLSKMFFFSSKTTFSQAIFVALLKMRLEQMTAAMRLWCITHQLFTM